MEGNKQKPRGILVFGAPCSGKTTFAEEFGRKYKLATYDLTSLREGYGFSHEEILVIVGQILKTKQTIVIEGELSTEKERVEMRNLLREHGYEPALVWIQTDMVTLKARLKSKFKSVSKAKSFYDAAVAKIEAPSENERAIVLSGKHTFETQAKHVVKGLAGLADTK